MRYPKRFNLLAATQRQRVSSFISNTSSRAQASFLSTSTTANPTNSFESSSNKHCPILQQALPDLQARFRKLAEKNEEGVFPILSPTIVKTLQKRWKPDEYDKRAAVLIPLFSHNGVPSILFTARSPHVPMNPSEISFVGGHQELGETLEETALREAQEELLGNYPWKDPNTVVLLGRGTTIPAITGIPVTPIICVMMEEISEPSLSNVFPGCENEVEAVFGMPIAELFETEDSHELPNHRLLEKESNGPFYPSPHGDIWGLTAFMLRPLLHKLYKPVFHLKRQQ